MTQLRRILGLAVFVGVATLLVMAPALVRGQGGGTVVITPPPPVPVTSPRITINNSPGNHTDPHVSGDLASYTDGTTATSLRYYRFSTAVDQAILSPAGADDSLSDVSGNRIIFRRGDQNGCDSILLFDVTTASETEVGVPQTCPQRFRASIGGNTVAYIDFASGTGVTFASDVSSPGPGFGTVQLSSGAGSTQKPEVAPSGNVVVWEQCPGSITANCDVMASVFNPAPANTWNSAFLVTNSAANPDTDGNWIVYDATRAANPTGRDIYFQPVAGGTERQLALAGEQSNPSIRAGVIGFESRATATSQGDIFVYVISTNTLYQVTNTPNIDDRLTDVSVLPNGDVRVVWAANDGFNAADYNVYATTFTPAGGDFTFDAIPGMSITAGSSASANVNVNSVNGFSSAVNLNVSGQPAGVTATVLPSSVTPSGTNSASSVLNVSTASFVTPTNFALAVTGASGSLNHSATANVAVSATTSSTSNSIGDMLNAGCIDNAGIGNALTSKLSAAQSAGSVQTAINTLKALKNQVQAQAGKHIHTACTIGGVAFNPVNVLLLDVQALIDSLRVSLIPDPITGYVVDANGVGLAGATVSVLDSGGAVVATATTDITGFYFLATTGVLTPGAAYTITVTGVPTGFGNVTPPNQSFTWQGTAVAFSNFVLN